MLAAIGTIYVILGIIYPLLIVVVLISRSNKLKGSAKALYVVQAIALPFVLLLCGLILLYQGWRLVEPLLLLSHFLLMVLINYLVFKDILLNFMDRGR